MLRELQAAAVPGRDLRELARGLIDSKEDGRIKLYTTWRTLNCRRDHPGLFSAGDYVPLAPEGSAASHLFAFARRAGEIQVFVAVPRLLITRLVPIAARPPLGPEAWGDTRLRLAGLDPALHGRNVFTGELLAPAKHGGDLSLDVADLFRHFPVALVLGETRPE